MLFQHRSLASNNDIPNRLTGKSGTGRLLVALTLGALLLVSAGLLAKEKRVVRTVTGAVLDEGENGLVGATVALTDLRTGERTAAYTQEGGRYQFSDLNPAHDYEIRASYHGATSEVRRISSIDTRTRIVINLRIVPPK